MRYNFNNKRFSNESDEHQTIMTLNNSVISTYIHTLIKSVSYAN